MKKIISLLAIIFFTSMLYSSDYEYKYRLTLTDKGVDTTSGLGAHAYGLPKPNLYLSEKAIGRRKKQNIKIDYSDIPISENYLQSIEKTGGIIVAKSKWNQTVAVHVKDSLMIDTLISLSFVRDAKLVWRGKIKTSTFSPDTIERYKIQIEKNDSCFYGLAYNNIKMLKGDILHQRGFTGKGMTIAVIDAGFNNYGKIDFLDNINLAGHKSFVYENDNLFAQKNEHGLNVISTMGTNKPNLFVGTAPHASFWMLGTEDSASEFPIEEDYWAAAIEFADSLGVDLVNTSLGYTEFDPPVKGHSKSSLDGKSTLISKAASMAAQKGMLLVISAGNAGNKPWGTISAPADARGVLTVGAVMRDSTISAFSSRGLTADLRVKPDVVALGSGTALIDDKGKVVYKSGTSFSSPIVCGIVACLWQAYPTLTNFELLDIIIESADRFDNPTPTYGYGIPDMGKAMDLAKVIVDRKERRKKK